MQKQEIEKKIKKEKIEQKKQLLEEKKQKIREEKQQKKLRLEIYLLEEIPLSLFSL